MQSAQTLLETTTSLSGDDVLSRAKAFFSSRPSLYAAFVDKEGPSFVSFRGQGTEELVIAVSAGENGSTRVSGSTYLFDMQVSRFFATLPPVPQ
jgi:hypothetical protein